MNVMPASVHFRANVGFSLNWKASVPETSIQPLGPYKSVAWVYALAALIFGNLDDAIAVQVGRGVSQVHGIGRA